ncbi:UDP-N-acetylglucosamine 2-epimerase, partial [Bacillus subtilis]|uniref:UDP-N-acetylglucosamine 2-epimerase n=1 Tax=Bacillus subtilis TaxID=1423 RepID=UPI002DB562EB
EDNIYQLTKQLLTDQDEYRKMSQASNPYGDGWASRRIAEALLYSYGYRRARPDVFKDK